MESLVPINNQLFLKQEKDDIFSETGGIYLIKRGTMFKDKDIDKKIVILILTHLEVLT